MNESHTFEQALCRLQTEDESWISREEIILTICEASLAAAFRKTAPQA
jgi:hypothetical protein